MQEKECLGDDLPSVSLRQERLNTNGKWEGCVTELKTAVEISGSLCGRKIWRIKLKCKVLLSIKSLSQSH